MKVKEHILINCPHCKNTIKVKVEFDIEFEE